MNHRSLDREGRHAMSPIAALSIVQEPDSIPLPALISIQVDGLAFIEDVERFLEIACRSFESS